MVISMHERKSRKKGKAKKGFLFTASLVITALVISSLAVFVMQTGYSERRNTASVAVFDTMKNDIDWIGNGIIKIIKAADLNVSVYNHTVSIREPLPNPHFSNFSDNIANWTAFAGNFSFTKPSISTSGFENDLGFVFSPSLTIYTHPNGFGGDSIMVESASEVTKYTIDIIIDTLEGTDLNWDIQSGGTDLDIVVATHASNETAQIQTLDPDVLSRLFVWTPSGTITIEFGSPTDRGRHVISNPNSINATVETNVTLAFTNKPTIQFPIEVISSFSNIINASTGSNIHIA